MVWGMNGISLNLIKEDVIWPNYGYCGRSGFRVSGDPRAFIGGLISEACLQLGI